MKFLERRRLIHGMLAGSLLLNLALFANLANSGGLRRIFIKLNLVDVPPERPADMEEAEARFRKLPSRPGEVVFAGDSLIAQGPWSEFYSSIHNRGILGETTSGLLRRLDEVTEDRPHKLIFLIGANDLAAALPTSRLLANYREILEKVRRDSPATSVEVLGLLPVNRAFPGSPNFTSAKIREVNAGLKGLVAEFPGARFTDLGESLSDAAGDLRPEFTADGLHLKTEGYLAIRERVEGLALGGHPTPSPRREPSPP